MELHELMGKNYQAGLITAARIGVGRRSMVCISARCLCWISLRQIPGVHRCRWQTICASARPPHSLQSVCRGGVSHKSGCKTYAASGFISQKEGKGPVPCAASG